MCVEGWLVRCRDRVGASARRHHSGHDASAPAVTGGAGAAHRGGRDHCGCCRAADERMRQAWGSRKGNTPNPTVRCADRRQRHGCDRPLERIGARGIRPPHSVRHPMLPPPQHHPAARCGSHRPVLWRHDSGRRCRGRDYLVGQACRRCHRRGPSSSSTEAGRGGWGWLWPWRARVG